ncbi:MAG: hypothetical protein VX904_03460, partial [Planctomycetota bacterium]|nr:hypothetical protein [Planctomycetota bacterium]
ARKSSAMLTVWQSLVFNRTILNQNMTTVCAKCSALPQFLVKQPHLARDRISQSVKFLRH